MQSSHATAVVSSAFDDSNLIAYGGLEPVVRLAERCGLPALAQDLVRLPSSRNGTGAFPAAKAMSLVGGMVASADSIDDMDRLRHGAMGRLFTGVRAPSTLGAFLRSFTHGHVKQPHAVARRFLPEPARHTALPPGAGQVAHVDVDGTIRRTHGYAEQGAGYGYNKVKGLNALLGIVSTPLSAPVIAATRLRNGPANSARGAAGFVAETIRTARACGATGPLIVRADSASYGADVINACRAQDAHFSITVRTNASIKKTIAVIDEAAWRPIKYPQALRDEEGQCWISDAEIAEIGYTAFTSKPKKQQVTAHLIVRRVKRLNLASVPTGQRTLFDTRRDHAAFTNSPLCLTDAERDHRRHAVVEQAIADMKSGPPAHLPSGDLQANTARLTLAAITHNLTRALGTPASAFHARATTSTLRDQLIVVPTRTARGARRLTLQLPANRPRRDAWLQLFTASHTPPHG